MSRVTCNKCGEYPAVGINGFTAICSCKNKKPTYPPTAAIKRATQETPKPNDKEESKSE